MDPRIANLPPNHPRRRMLEGLEARQSDPLWIAAEVERRAQANLDAFAKSRGYDGILSACTYVSSTNPKFASEAQQCVALRDSTWAALYAIQAAVQAGTRPLPTVEQTLAELPAPAW